VTVGKLDVYPNSPNTVPGRVELIVDLRCSHQDEGQLVWERLGELADEIGNRRRIRVERSFLGGGLPTVVDVGMLGVLEKAAAELSIKQRRVLSLAGHDAMELARRYPVAMVLIANPTGISHSPEETFDEQGLADALRLIVRAVPRLLEIPPASHCL
jgi:acetylornithine deacetylase/succinyl-diaminopimelate desuccinylase-like protein